MRLLHGVLLFLLIPPSLAACGPREPEFPFTLRFHWPPEGRVHVLDEVEKQQTTAVLRYDLAWEPDPEGSGFILRYEDFQFVKLNGIPANNPRLRDALAASLPMTSALPDLHISADGSLLEICGWEEMIEQFVQYTAEARLAVRG